MTKFLTKLRKNDDGATAIEYGLIAALVAVALIIALGQFGTDLAALFTGLSGQVTTATPTT